jgi:aminoglycoside 6'-N-acetyltransferase
MSTIASLRPFRPEHLDVLSAWLAEPHVARWYPEPEANLLWAANPPSGGSQAVIAAGDANVGYLRWQRVDRSTLDALGLYEIPANSVDADILLGNAMNMGKAIGVAALQALTAEIRRDPTVPLIGLTTSVANVHAHRAFKKAGFRIARQYDPNGLGPCHLMVLEMNAKPGGKSR